jgi:type I restriction enzyme S subunit
VTGNIERKAHGFKTTLVHVRKADITGQVIGVPPLAEQRKIVAILGAWDEAIAAAERLVAALRHRKRGLMRQLLIVDRESGQPARRFPGSVNPWRSERLDQIFARVTRKNSTRNTNVLTASGEHGLVSQAEYFKRVIAGEAIENYYLLHRGEFAYNRSSSDGYPYGAVKQLVGHDAGILSTLYLCFCLADATYDDNFYRHFFEAGGLNHGIYSIAQEGARNHGLLNVGVADFFGLHVPVPEPAEQLRLAKFFDTVDEEINVAEQHLALLRQQKRGLMQLLLTGQVRVPIE